MQLSHNQRKLLHSLRSNSERDAHELFIAEGEKLCRELLESNFQAEYIVVRTPITPAIQIIAQEFSQRGIEIYEANNHVFGQISDAHSPQGILAAVRYPQSQETISDRIIILDGIADPGNAGTIIRTADWFGFDTVLFTGNSAHRFNPKTVRATMGSLWRVNLLQTADSEQFIGEHLAGYTLYGASLRAERLLSECIPTGKYGVVFGSESHGISPEVHKLLTYEYSIPSYGTAESLNVSIAAGISLYHFAMMQ